MLAANEAFYEAFEHRDLDAMSDLWERSERALCTHPGWSTLHGWGPIASSFAQIDRTLLEASATLGAGRLRTFIRIVAPLSIEGIIAGAVLTFAHTLGEFGVVLMVGGNLPGVTRTVSIAIYDDVQSLNMAAAHETALVLLAVSFAALAIVYALVRKPWAVAPVS